MFQRLFYSTKWISCFLVVSFGSTWNPVSGGSLPAPQNAPSTIEAQAKFFQDFFSVQLSPYKIEFGHVCEDPNNWEQRYEKKDFKNHRDMGKVRWGDKKGGYGEHYWDLNHAGHTDDNGHEDYDHSDDGSYHEDPNSNDESSEKLQQYEIDEYNPDDTSHHDENGRAKRANTRVKSKQQKDDRNNNEKAQLSKEHRQSKNTEEDDEPKEDSSEEYVTTRPLKVKTKRRLRKPQDTEDSQTKEKNDIVLIVNRKQKDDEVEDYKPQEPKPFESYDNAEPKRFMSYEEGAGVRQHVPHDPLPSASVPRLFLDQSTGYIIDRTTGQAFVLQPVHQHIQYS